MSMPNSMQWKQLERTAAKKLGGVRKLRRTLHFGISDSDVDHAAFIIDCKYGKQNPETYWAMAKGVKGVILKPKAKQVKDPAQDPTAGTYLLYWLDDFVELLNREILDLSGTYTLDGRYRGGENKIREIRAKYAKGADAHKVPLLVMKRTGCRGELCFVKLDELYEAHKLWKEAYPNGV